MEQDSQYLEGQWAGLKMVENIELTMYHTLEDAIKAKQELIEQFEKHFGYTREMKNPDPNYAYNLGILDILIENYNELG